MSSSSGGLGRERLQNKNQYTYMGQTGNDAPLQDLAANMADKLKQSSAMSNLAFGGPGFSGSFNTPAGAAPDPQTKTGSFNPFGGAANPFKTNQSGPSSPGGSPAPGAPDPSGDPASNPGAPAPTPGTPAKAALPPPNPVPATPAPVPAKAALPPPNPVAATVKPPVATVGMHMKLGSGVVPEGGANFAWNLDPATGDYVASEKPPAGVPNPSTVTDPRYLNAQGAWQPGPGI